MYQVMCTYLAVIREYKKVCYFIDFLAAAPKNRPFLLGLRARYKAGDTLRANCTSAESRPAANLSWLLNGHQVGHTRLPNNHFNSMVVVDLLIIGFRQFKIVLLIIILATRFCSLKNIIIQLLMLSLDH